jgi:hypothetical protein
MSRPAWSAGSFGVPLVVVVLGVVGAGVVGTGVDGWLGVVCAGVEGVVVAAPPPHETTGKIIPSTSKVIRTYNPNLFLIYSYSLLSF